jgi:hypothetical protein
VTRLFRARPPGGSHAVCLSIHAPEEENKEILTKLYGTLPELTLYLTLMISSRSTVVTTVTPPPKLVKAQIKRKATPLPVACRSG